MNLKIILLCVALFFGYTSTVSAANSSIRGNILIEMMLTMLEAMGFDTNDQYSDTYPNYNQIPYQPPPYSNNPWSLTSPPITSFNPSTNQSVIIPYRTESFQAKKNHWIEGKWLSSDGMILEVRQGQFKMYYRHAPQHVRSGLIRLKERWLAIYEKSHQITRQYEFAHKDGNLVLKDNNGRLMLFKRLIDWSTPFN